MLGYKACCAVALLGMLGCGDGRSALARPGADATVDDAAAQDAPAAEPEDAPIPSVIDPDDCYTDRCDGAVQLLARCARDEAGSLYCADSRANEANSLPEGVPVDQLVATDVTWLAAGGLHLCALHQDETVSCWGKNVLGSLGQPGLEDFAIIEQPAPVAGLNEVVRLLSRATFYDMDTTCAQRRDGSVWCWGHFWPATPTVAFELEGSLELTLSDDHACGLTGARTVRCAAPGRSTVERTFDAHIVQIDAAWYQVCALGVDQILRCFDFLDRDAALPVGSVRELVSNISDTCAIGLDGSARCIDVTNGIVGSEE